MYNINVVILDVRAPKKRTERTIRCPTNLLYIRREQMARKLTQEEFIRKARKIHGNKYGYGLVRYINNRTKIEIKCPVHGIFLQKPNGHLLGYGCCECAVQKRSKLRTKTVDSFFKKAKLTHNNKYNYSLVVYKNRNTKIKIICSKCHRKFEQTPNAHLRGSGCLRCSGSMPKNTKTFIKEASLVHGGKYNYKLTIYKSAHSKIKISCPIHGVFEQTPSNHLNGHGCQKCKVINSGKVRRKSKSQFIKEANKIHNNKYDYKLVHYRRGHYDKVKIKCLIHGIFKQTPHSHLSGRGCPKCNGSISKMETLWLNSLNLPRYVKRNQTIRINKKRYNVDALNHKNHTIYEFNGDFFHGNPQVYKKQDYNAVCHKTFGELYRKTIEKESALKKSGYSVVSIWESDFKRLQLSSNTALSNTPLNVFKSTNI